MGILIQVKNIGSIYLKVLWQEKVLWQVAKYTCHKSICINRALPLRLGNYSWCLCGGDSLFYIGDGFFIRPDMSYFLIRNWVAVHIIRAVL